MQYTSPSDRTTALYVAIRLDAATVNFASALARSRQVSEPVARIAPKGRTLYTVTRSRS